MLVLATSIQPQLKPTVDEVIPEEYKGSATVNVQFEEPHDVEWYCLNGNYSPEYIIYACYKSDKDLIIAPNPCLYPESKIVGTFAHLMCHEKAHKNGWRH